MIRVLVLWGLLISLNVGLWWQGSGMLALAVTLLLFSLASTSLYTFTMGRQFPEMVRRQLLVILAGAGLVVALLGVIARFSPLPIPTVVPSTMVLVGVIVVAVAGEYFLRPQLTGQEAPGERKDGEVCVHLETRGSTIPFTLVAV